MYVYSTAGYERKGSVKGTAVSHILELAALLYYYALSGTSATSGVILLKEPDSNRTTSYRYLVDDYTEMAFVAEPLKFA